MSDLKGNGTERLRINLCIFYEMLLIIWYFFKLNLLNNYIKQHEMHIYQFPRFVASVSEFFGAALETTYEWHSYYNLLNYCFLQGKNVCYFHYIYCSRNTLKYTNRKFCAQTVIYYIMCVCVCLCTETNCPIFVATMATNIEY